MEREQQSNQQPLDDEEHPAGREQEAVATSGKQAGRYVDKHALPISKEPKGKCEQKPSMSISKGHQNAER